MVADAGWTHGKRNRLGRWVAGLALPLMLAGGVVAWQARAEAQRSSTFAKAVPPESIGVGALGRLEPGWKVLQLAPASATDGARVESLLVEEGEEVLAGAVVAILDMHGRRDAALREARAHVRVAAAKLAQVKIGAKAGELAAQEALIDQLRAATAKAEADHSRSNQLRGNGAISAEEHDQRQFQAQMARANLRQAEATLSALRIVRPEDVSVAEAELAKAEAGITRAEADLEATNIRTPISGRVLKIHTRPGEKIGEPGLLDIGDTRAMHAVAEVFERDVPRVRAGLRVFVRVQSLPGEFSGEVVHVGWKVGRRATLDNDPVRDTDARVVEVRVRLDPAWSARLAGLSQARVEVRIEIPAGE